MTVQTPGKVDYIDNHVCIHSPITRNINQSVLGIRIRLDQIILPDPDPTIILNRKLLSNSERQSLILVHYELVLLYVFMWFLYVY